MAKFYSTQLLLVFLVAFLVSSIQGFSPSVGLGPQVRTFAAPTELWGKKKKKKNKKKKKDSGAVAVLEPPTEEEAAPIAVVKEPVADLEDPAATMIANEMFHRELLAQKLAYDAQISEVSEMEVETTADPVAVAVQPEPEPEPEPEPVAVDLSAKYAAIDDVGERAYEMLKDLGMFE